MWSSTSLNPFGDQRTLHPKVRLLPFGATGCCQWPSVVSVPLLCLTTVGANAANSCLFEVLRGSVGVCQRTPWNSTPPALGVPGW